MTALVIIPTYNERDNITALVDALVALETDVHVRVVDDSSPDGTSDVVATAIADKAGWRGLVTLDTRDGKGGRGGAVRDGLRFGIDAGEYDAFVEMDADFSHDPETIPKGLDMLDDGYDVVIGRRYPDGEIIGWPRSRRIFSAFANTVARAAIEWSISDYTNGYRFYSRNAAAVIVAEPQRNTGYIYLSEMLAVCLAAGMRVGSFPIVFRNRERGESNTNLSELWSAAKGIVGVARWYSGASRRVTTDETDSAD